MPTIKAYAVIKKNGNLCDNQLSETVAVYMDKSVAEANMECDKTPYLLVPCSISYELPDTIN